MKRLTKRNSDGSVGIAECRYYNYEDFQRLARKLAKYEDLEEQCVKDNQFGLHVLCEKWKAFFEDIAELLDYRKKQEEGLIPILMPNDIVWGIDYGRPKAWRITAFSFGSSDYIDAPNYKNEMVYYYENIGRTIQGSFPSSEIGTEIFLTEAKAKEALERMQG